MTKSIKTNLRFAGRKARSVLDFAVIAALMGYSVLFVLEVAQLPLA